MLSVLWAGLSLVTGPVVSFTCSIGSWLGSKSPINFSRDNIVLGTLQKHLKLVWQSKPWKAATVVLGYFGLAHSKNDDLVERMRNPQPSPYMPSPLFDDEAVWPTELDMSGSDVSRELVFQSPANPDKALVSQRLKNRRPIEKGLRHVGDAGLPHIHAQDKTTATTPHLPQQPTSTQTGHATHIDKKTKTSHRRVGKRRRSTPVSACAKRRKHTNSSVFFTF